MVDLRGNRCGEPGRSRTLEECGIGNLPQPHGPAARLRGTRPESQVMRPLTPLDGSCHLENPPLGPFCMPEVQRASVFGRQKLHRASDTSPRNLASGSSSCSRRKRVSPHRARRGSLGRRSTVWYYRTATSIPDPASRSQPMASMVRPRCSIPTPFEWGDEEFDWEPWWKSVSTNSTRYFLRGGHLRRCHTLCSTTSSSWCQHGGAHAGRQFPGRRNWGYDGVFPYAAQDSYGGPRALQRFVDACHGRGLAVVLDVVYNHIGPEGTCCHNYGPYFTDRYRTPGEKP